MPLRDDKNMVDLFPCQSKNDIFRQTVIQHLHTTRRDAIHRASLLQFIASPWQSILAMPSGLFKAAAKMAAG